MSGSSQFFILQIFCSKKRKIVSDSGTCVEFWNSRKRDFSMFGTVFR